MFCTKCGREAADGTKFCTRCGQLLQMPSGSNAPKITPKYEVPDMDYEGAGNMETKKNSILPIVIGGMLAVVLFIGGILAGTQLLQMKSEQPDVVKSGATAEQQNTENAKETEMEKKAEADAKEEKKDSDEVKVKEEDIYTLAGVEKLDSKTQEGKLQKEIITMNTKSDALQKIDVYKADKEPKQRDKSYTWNQNVFYSLEGLENHSGYYNKNQCRLIKKELINKKTGNIMDYEIYINPSTNVANKIVSIEYLRNGIEVTEYYYTNKKKPNFVFQYKTDNYVSTYANPSIPGERFLFYKDCMTTWRKTESGGHEKNYAIGNNEKNRLRRQSRKAILLSSLDKKGREKFAKKEKRMLNAAYNTYKIAMKAKGISIIQGYIYDESEDTISNVEIELYDKGFSKLMYKGKTNSDGRYRIFVPSDEYNYNIRLVKSGYDSCDIYKVSVNNEQIGVYQDSIYLFSEGGESLPVDLILGDAVKYDDSGRRMLSIPYADVVVRRGLNNRNGSEIVFEDTADSDGKIRIMLTPGVYTLEVSADGYETMYYTIISNPRGDNTYEFYAAPTLNSGEYAIVLTWGSNPSDLDSHLFTGRGDHIWYGGKEDGHGNYLDVDDTDSYGPETITIHALQSSDYYKYCVVDFTDCSEGDLSSYEMSYSQATVNVYSSDGLLGTFHVPTGTPGVIWEIFEIRNGRLTPIQRYYDNVTNKEWWHQDK